MAFNDYQPPLCLSHDHSSGVGMIDIINSKQYANRGGLYRCCSHLCATVHSHAMHDGLDVASHAWLHIAESVGSPASPNTFPKVFMG